MSEARRGGHWAATASEAYRAEPASVGPPGRRQTRLERMRAIRARRRRRAAGVAAVAVLVVVVIGAAFLGARLWQGMSRSSVADYHGPGKQELVVEVRPGDSTTAIAETLLDRQVVATVRAFLEAAQGNTAISSIQPGFYKLRAEIPAADAVRRLTDPQNRVGRVVIPEGRQLDDRQDVKTDVVTEGIFSLVSSASCVQLNGEDSCVPVRQLRQAASTESLQALGVPSWADTEVTAMGDDHRRLEGLIAPGTWNIDPTASAVQILASLIRMSADRYEESGLLKTAEALGLSPYEVLTVASLVQRESKPADFPKVARVIYNRLEVGQRLEFDATVNYPLVRIEVATTDRDRARDTPWNTYQNAGLPQTPICSPGDQALAAAEHPAQGDWLYFVTVDMDGTTLFTREYDQHLANIQLARSNGVLDSAR